MNNFEIELYNLEHPIIFKKVDFCNLDENDRLDYINLTQDFEAITKMFGLIFAIIFKFLHWFKQDFAYEMMVGTIQEGLSLDNYIRYDWLLYNNNMMMGHLSIHSITSELKTLLNVTDGLEIGLVISKSHRHQGYCKELIKNLLPNFKKYYGINSSKPFVLLVTNDVAKHLAESNGFTYIRKFDYVISFLLPKVSTLIYTLQN